METFIVVGLGNSGRQYAETRHNIGYLVADEMAGREVASSRFSVHKKSGTQLVEVRHGQRKVIVAKPLCLMNVSGRPVQALARFYSVNPSNIVVVHDDMELDFGQVAHKIGGGLAGHNGLRSIAQSLGTKEFQRIRVGIGRPPGSQPPASFVLKPFSTRERPELPFVCSDAVDVIEREVLG
ncbi:Peptidyl-tRNA hydrolase [Corynebacterium ciconiae DSM 44920]|uniref:aminoacyl-tRNA hydrolase n=1 Tax=Corynebacterium ciconiae TaxID=227319 RepID=UPI00036FC245|nr:aminoacyl-tRNA hydrolase [Corynebacterium ciconiae]WKD61601.1 Peptidyl-tRNA hydrolase [Corynebacterium ciconiae DSM 44920]